jgi:hypothetical protein
MRGSPSSPARRPVIQHLPQRRAIAGSRLGCGGGIPSYAPAIILTGSSSGNDSGGNTVETITLPPYTASSYILLIVNRNNTNASAFTYSGTITTATELANADTRRITAVQLTPNGLGQTSFTITGSAAVWSWWVGVYSGVDTAVPVATAANAIGNSTSAVIAIPEVGMGYIATGYELGIAVAGVNSTGTWATTPSTILVSNATVSASMMIEAACPAGGSLTQVWAPANRGLSGTNRSQESLALILQATPPGVVNLLSNPSFETVTGGLANGWTDEHTTVTEATYTQVTSGVTDGAFAQQFTYTGVAGDGGAAKTELFQAPVSASAGQILTFSVWLSGSLANTYIDLGIEAFTTGAVFISEADTYVVPASLTATPQLVSVTYTCPQGTSYVAAFISCQEIGATTSLTVVADQAELVVSGTAQPGTAPRPVIQHLPPRRAATGYLGRNAGGYPGHNACPAFPLAGPYVYQQMLVPAYSYPNPPGFWLNMMAAVPPVRYVVANVSSGPGVTADPNYTAVIGAALAAGLTVLGYVDTNYAAVPGATADANTALWQSLYGVTSIFFDRASALTGDEPYYATRASAVHATPGAITALNFGTIPDSGYMASADIAVVFEGDYATGWQAFTPAGWMAGYSPSRFCVLVANARTTAQMQSVLVTAKTGGIGVVYVTPEPSPPTYSVWPGNQYCPSEAAQISADNAVAAPGRPVIQHLPPRRAQAGPRARSAGAGLASRVSTPPGSPSFPAPRPVITHLPPRRGIGRGLASTALTPLGVVAPPRKVPLFPPRNTRGRIGRGTVSGGIASGGVTPPAPGTSSPFPSAPGRARPGLASPGIPPGPGPVPGSAPYLPAAALARRSPAPRRAIAGSNLQPAGGLVSRISTPLGAASRPKPFIFRSPAPRRGVAGNNGQCGDGNASTALTPLGSPSRPKPFVWRSPAPARARVGSRAAPAAGISSAVTTPLGVIAPPRLLLAWVSHPRTRALAGRSTAAAGLAGLTNPPLGSPSSPLPRPVIQHLPPRQARVGNNGLCGDGLSGNVTPRGTVGPPRPFVARKSPARAVVGNNLTCADGIASQVTTPLGTPPVSVVRPAIVHVPSVRAHIGPQGRNGGGNRATAVAALGAPVARAPQMAPRAIPSRARTGPLGRNTGGLAAPQAATAAMARRPSVFRSPAPHRAQVGNNLACGDGLAGLANPPLGVIPPRRIRQPWVSRPRTRAVTTAHPAVGGTYFTQGSGTVRAADSITRTVSATDRHVMSVTAADRLLMDVTASDYEP